MERGMHPRSTIATIIPSQHDENGDLEQLLSSNLPTRSITVYIMKRNGVDDDDE